MQRGTDLVGNLTADPELRYTSAGHPIASFGIAVTRRWLNRTTQQWDEATSYFDVTAWRDLAENVSGSLHRGDRVVVTGRLEQERWQADDGTKRSKIRVIADEGHGGGVWHGQVLLRICSISPLVQCSGRHTWTSPTPASTSSQPRWP